MRHDTDSKRESQQAGRDDCRPANAANDPSPDAAAVRTPGAARPKLPDPKEVLGDPTLTRDQKIEKLRRWSVDARRVEASNDDGLQGQVAPSNLPAIQAALRELDACEDRAADQPGIN